METLEAEIEPVTINEVLDLASWDRSRSNEELRDFVSRRAAMINF